MNDTPFDDIYSHPPEEGGQLLVTHLERVAAQSKTHVNDELAPQGTPLTTIAETCGWCHDIGKATRWFQHHLNNQYVSDDKLVHHSPLGALVTYACLRARGTTHEDAFVGLIAVAKHHGTLPNVAEHIRQNLIKNESRRTVLTKQIKDISDERGSEQVAKTVTDTASSGHLSWAEFRNTVVEGDIYDSLSEHATRGSRGQVPNRNACSNTFYESIISVWGGLTRSDKTDAADLPTNQSPVHLSPGAVQEYINTFDDAVGEEARLNEYRTDARESIVDAVSSLPTGGTLGTITLPTGLGKTLGSLDGATRRRAQHDEKSRIVYVLPYTSIVDQTADEVLSVFNVGRNEEEMIDPYGWALTIDHHLESTATRIRNGTDDASRPQDDVEPTDEFSDEELLLGTMWDSGVVVTTYVQLFESLVRPTNKQSVKIPSLRDAVVVLDEPQTLPLSWWLVTRRVVHALTETFDSTVLSMSATQPHLFTHDDAFDDDISFDATELVDDPSRYFEAFHRTDYHLHESVNEDSEMGLLGHDVAAQTLVGTIRETDSSALAICNTVASAQELSTEVGNTLARDGIDEVQLGALFEQRLNGVESADAVSVDDLVDTVQTQCADGAVVTLHMTSRHRPADRRPLLDAAEKLATADVPFVFVATQLVEAGVDVSFRRVYRDIAPMPNLVQAAGRCNRSFEADKGGGDVTIWRLGPIEGDDTPPSEYVYVQDHDLLRVTYEALSTVFTEGVTTVADTIIAEVGIEAYYDELIKTRPGNRSFVKHLNDGEFQTLFEEAEFIEERDTVEVVVCRTQDDISIVNEYGQYAETEQYKSLRRTRAKLSERSVSVPRRDYDAATVDVDVLSTDDKGRATLVSILNDDGWFSSTYGVATDRV